MLYNIKVIPLHCVFMVLDLRLKGLFVVTTNNFFCPSDSDAAEPAANIEQTRTIGQFAP